ncbi:bS21 family ribosomal protein [Microgenomates group bacterium]|nr:bS21 family ribosomal protein [Microgenomates group bacterium]
MAIVIKARPGDSTGDLVKRFKKAVTSSNMLVKVKDRQFHQRPSQARKMAGNDMRRLARRLRGLKKMKNIDPEIISRMTDKISTT